MFGDLDNKKIKVIWMLLILGFVSLMASGEIDEWIQYNQSEDWARVDATVSDTNLLFSVDGEGFREYTAEVTYHYEWLGRKYESNKVTQYSEDTKASNTKSKWMHEVLTKHRDDKTPISIYINPDKPSQSAAFRTYSWGVIGFWIICALLPCIAFTDSMLDSQQENYKASLDSELRNAHPNEPWKWREIWRDNIVSYRSESTNHDQKTRAAINLVYSILALLAIAMLSEELGATTFFLAIVVLPFLFFAIIKLLQTYRQNLLHEIGDATEFALNNVPLYTGEKLSGKIWGLSALPRNTALKINVKCIERRNLDKKGWQNKTLWKHAIRTQLKKSHLKDGLFIETTLPEDLPDIDWQSTHSQTLWVLSIKAVNRKIKFKKDFELPVFKKTLVSQRTT